MKIQKIADGAFFVPAYSEQTITWSPIGYTFQGVAFDEICGDTEPVQFVQEEPFSKGDFEQALKRVSRKRMPVGEHIREAFQIIKGSND